MAERYRIIIAGSRDYTPSDEEITDAIVQWIHDTGFRHGEIEAVVCGMAKGADLAGKAWAEKNGIDVEKFPANWNKHGKAAGKIRNWEMARSGADGLIAFWDGDSPGTAHMIAAATWEGLQVLIRAHEK